MSQVFYFTPQSWTVQDRAPNPDVHSNWHVFVLPYRLRSVVEEASDRSLSQMFRSSSTEAQYDPVFIQLITKEDRSGHRSSHRK